MKRILLFTCILWFSLQTFADTIWSGSVVMPASWGVWQTISPTKFAQVEVGDMLRLYASDVHSGAQGRICTGSWGDMPDAPIVVEESHEVGARHLRNQPCSSNREQDYSTW